MKEQDYVKVTNKANLVAVNDLLRNIMAGKEYELDEALLAQAIALCYVLQDQAFKAITKIE